MSIDQGQQGEYMAKKIRHECHNVINNLDSVFNFPHGKSVTFCAEIVNNKCRRNA
jgi:hypothetical protein